MAVKPLHQRIEAAEAYVDIVWQKYLDIPDGRGFDSQRAAEHERAKLMDQIDFMLGKMLPMYDERILLAAGNLDAEIA